MQSTIISTLTYDHDYYDSIQLHDGRPADVQVDLSPSRNIAPRTIGLRVGLEASGKPTGQYTRCDKGP
jgi:hypothetical protein